MAVRLIRKIGALFQILRWPNLFMVAICLILFHHILQKSHPSLILDGPFFTLFVLVNLLITASGYIVNDHFDQETDRINKPIRGTRYATILPCTARKLYLICTSIGAVLAFYIAIKLDHSAAFILYPIAVALLYVYARTLKGKVFFGNLLVGCMTACVPLVILIPEWSWIQTADTGIKHRILLVFFGFALFSFTISLFREFVKDLEDVKGDRAAGWMTVPVLYGQRVAKNLAKSTGFFVLILVAATLFLVPLSHLSIGLFALVFMLMTGLLIYLERAHQPAQFHHISQGAKILLALGLLTVVSL